MLPSQFIEQVVQELRKQSRLKGCYFMGKVSPREDMWKGVCLPGLKSSTDLAFSQAHDVESSPAFPGEKRREEN